jgi:hypothetical protein
VAKLPELLRESPLRGAAAGGVIAEIDDDVGAIGLGSATRSFPSFLL